MPIEIKELIIKASVTAGAGDASEKGEESFDKGEIVRDCVEQVLRILEREKER